MKTTERILGINLFILVLYTFLIHAFVGSGDDLAAAMISYGHASVLILLAIIDAIMKKERGYSHAGAFVLSALLVAIIGFSVCLGTLELNLH